MEWVAIPLLLLGGILFTYFGPNARRARRYECELATRELVYDEELASRYFSAGEIAPDMPGRVRRVFANLMGYPAEKMLPDDDLLFFWFDLDLVYLIRDLEAEFDLELTTEDILQIGRCSIRTFTHLVASKTSARA